MGKSGAGHEPERARGGAVTIAPCPTTPLRRPPHLRPPPGASLARARYLDARARGLAHGAATREAAALLWALWPSLPARQTEELAADIVAAVAAP